MVSLGEGSEELPIPVDLPDFDDEGPHLAYAIQWFGFALVGLVGFYFLVRNKGRSGQVVLEIETDRHDPRLSVSLRAVRAGPPGAVSGLP